MSDLTLDTVKKYFFIFILLFVSGILLFKNSLLYSYEVIDSYSLDASTMMNYVEDGNIWMPQDGDACIQINGISEITNEIDLTLYDGLIEASNVTLFIYTDTGEIPIETRTVRKGYNSIKFHFADTEIIGVRIQAVSADGNRYVAIPDGVLSCITRFFNPLQRNAVWIIRMACVFCVSVVLTVVLSLLSGGYNVLEEKKRQSNIELLRVIAMFLLVGHHLAVHGGVLTLDPNTFNQKFGLLFLPVGKICFDAYIAISMWFMVDAKLKYQRFLKTWFQVVLYSVGLTIVAYLYGANIRPIDFFSSFFVMIGNSHGFAASYLIFLLIAPFLHKITKNITKLQARYLLFVLFWIQVVSQIMRAATGYNQPVYSEVTLFVLCFVLSLNLKRWPVRFVDNRLCQILVVLGVYVYVFCFTAMAYKGVHTLMIDFLLRIASDESSVFFIVAGYALFYLFKGLRIGCSKIINRIAQFTFGILLIHDHNFLRHIFWNEIVRTETWYGSENIVMYYLITMILVFLVCGVIDYLRKELLEETILKTEHFKIFTRGVDECMEG